MRNLYRCRPRIWSLNLTKTKTYTCCSNYKSDKSEVRYEFHKNSKILSGQKKSYNLLASYHSSPPSTFGEAFSRETWFYNKLNARSQSIRYIWRNFMAPKRSFWKKLSIFSNSHISINNWQNHFQLFNKRIKATSRSEHKLGSVALWCFSR